MHKLFHFFISLFLSTAVAYGQIQQNQLSNGLTILIKEDHRAPIVMVMMWYHVGSADEPGDRYGVSHILEHLMFKGTSAYPVGTFARTITQLGGEFNALTNNDYTVYYEKIAATHLATSFQLEADRMQHLLWDETAFAKEIQVIQEERRLRIDTNPQALALERFLATAHLSSPYQHPVIGWMYNLRQMTLQDAKAWYQQYYAPNNATLVVVGDVQASQVLALAKQYFGALSPIRQIPHKPQAEPPALGKKTVQIHAAAQLPILLLGYSVPSINTVTPTTKTTPYVLEVIAGLLGAGDSGRFGRFLEHGQEIATSTAVYYNLYARYQTQFVLFGIPSQNHTLDDLKVAIQTQIKRLQTEQVTVQELQRIKIQIIAQKTFEKDALFNQAMTLGLLETIGLGWAVGEQYIDQINAVTPQQIQAAAQHYFQENNLTEAELHPS